MLDAIQKRTKAPNIIMALPKSEMHLSQKRWRTRKSARTGSKYSPRHGIAC